MHGEGFEHLGTNVSGISSLVLGLGFLTFRDSLGIWHTHGQSHVFTSKLCVWDQAR